MADASATHPPDAPAAQADGEAAAKALTEAAAKMNLDEVDDGAFADAREDATDDEEGTDVESDNGGEAGSEKTTCTSTVPTGPVWELGKPELYTYEEMYVGADGAVDDHMDKPDLKDHVCNIPARLFHLRGPHYLSESATNNKRLKQASAAAAYAVIGLKVFQSRNDMSHAAVSIMPLAKFLQDQMEHDAKHGAPVGDAPPYIVLCWNFSNFFKTEYTSVVHVMRRSIKIDSSETGEDPALDRAFSRWLKLSDDEKNAKLKYACIMREANAQLRGAIDMLGGERPVLIGKRLTTTYHTGEGYLEIDMDVGSSNVASMLNGILLKTSGSLVVDECFCIEGQAEDELPERALCALRWNHCSLDTIRHTLDAMGNLVS